MLCTKWKYNKFTFIYYILLYLTSIVEILKIVFVNIYFWEILLKYNKSFERKKVQLISVAGKKIFIDFLNSFSYFIYKLFIWKKFIQISYVPLYQKILIHEIHNLIEFYRIVSIHKWRYHYEKHPAREYRTGWRRMWPRRVNKDATSSGCDVTFSPLNHDFRI